MREARDKVIALIVLAAAVLAIVLTIRETSVGAQTFPIVRARIEAWGTAAVTGAAALSDTFSNPTVGPVGSFPMVWNTSTWQRLKGTSLNTFQVASNAASSNESGRALIERGPRWVVTSAPAANSQGTASVAAEASVRHVADCVTWSADSSAAVTAAAGSVVLRDGATGAGTVLMTWRIAHTVAAGAGVQTIPPFQICGLNLTGTTNTAMTAEFNAGVTGEEQSVSLTGWNVF